MEIIGPGYDSSDLRRGLVPPHYVVTSNFRAQPILFYDTPYKLSPFDVTITKITGTDEKPILEEERRKKRLAVIGGKILPSMGIHLKGEGDALLVETEKWLREGGYDFLWTRELSLSFEDIQTWVAEASALAFYFFRKGIKPGEVVLCGSVLSDFGRAPEKVYWDYYTTARWDISSSFMLRPKMKE